MVNNRLRVGHAASLVLFWHSNAEFYGDMHLELAAALQYFDGCRIRPVIGCEYDCAAQCNVVVMLSKHRLITY